MRVFQRLLFFPRYVFMISVRLYQLLFSPDHSFWAKDAFPEGYCKFYPTCSEYGHQVFFKYGVFRGGIKTVWRILRCNPWSAGGIDKP